MTTEHKNFVQALPATPAQKAFILINKLGFAIFNIVFGKNGIVTFDTLSQFNVVESLSLDKPAQMVFDLFHDFNSTKNAIAVILHTIENNGTISDESYKNQSKITPAVEDYPKNATFAQFWAFLTDDQKAEAVRIAKAWLVSEHIAETSFEFFLTNGTNGVTLEDGQYVMGYDAMTGKKAMTRIFQASPGGLVTAIDNGGHFTLPKSFRAEVVSREQMPKEVTEILDEKYDALTEQADEQKTYRLDNAIKAADKAAEIAAKAEAKAEKTKAAEELKKSTDAKKKAEFDRLMALKLTSDDAIAKAAGDLNNAKLAKEQVEKVRAKIKDAKTALKAKADAAKEAAKGKETATATPTAPKATETAKTATKTPPAASTTAKATTATAAPAPTRNRTEAKAATPKAEAPKAKMEVVKTDK